MATSSRLSLLSPLRIWLIFNVLLIALVASSWYSSYRLAAADEQRLVTSQIHTLTKSGFEDLKNRRFRDFVEGVGREFTGLYIQVRFSDQTYESGERPTRGHCAEQTESLGGSGTVDITMCRPFTLSTRPILAVLFVYLVISGLSLAYVRRLERRTTDALVDFLQASGVQVDAQHGLVGIMADIRDIRARLDRAKVQERQLLESRARSELAEQMAHDIRSPLAALQGLASTSPSLPEESRDLLQKIVERVQGISDGLLARQRIKSAPGAPSPQPLAALVKDVIAEKILEVQGRAGIQIDAVIVNAAGRAEVRIQKTEMHRVLSNLLNNAVEALQDGSGRVRVSLSSAEGGLRLQVEDDGRGMSPEVLQQVGLRGVSLGKDGGSGLGLHHARTCIESWGGRLDVGSQEGAGTTVTITLPYAIPERKSRGQGALDAVLIDDDPLVRKNWEVTAAKTGRKIRTLASVQEFLASSKDFHASTPVYIDSHLGDSVRGEEESRKIFGLGFKEIYIETGDIASTDHVPEHLRGVVGKTPPWSVAS